MTAICRRLHKLRYRTDRPSRVCPQDARHVRSRRAVRANACAASAPCGARYGITRVADTTHLDRTGIPTYSAMVPGSPDVLGVYNGKGITRESAIASAVMEAAERQIAARVELPIFRESLVSLASHRSRRIRTMRGGVAASSPACSAAPSCARTSWQFRLRSCNARSSAKALRCHDEQRARKREQSDRGALSCALRSDRTPRLVDLSRAVLARPAVFSRSGRADAALAPEIALPTGDPTSTGSSPRFEAAGLIVRALAFRKTTCRPRSSRP